MRRALLLVVGSHTMHHRCAAAPLKDATFPDMSTFTLAALLHVLIWVAGRLIPDKTRSRFTWKPMAINFQHVDRVPIFLSLYHSSYHRMSVRPSCVVRFPMTTHHLFHHFRLEFLLIGFASTFLYWILYERKACFQSVCSLQSKKDLNWVLPYGLQHEPYSND